MISMCPQCSNSHALVDPATVLGTRRQAHPMVCGWAQKGLDSGATLGCSLKATLAMKGKRP